MTAEDVNFVHISDTHFGPEQWSALNGANTFARAAAIVNAVNDLATKNPVDFVVHTGDVVTDGDMPGYDGQSTRIAASVLGSLNPPLHIVNGNHDDLQQLAEHFPISGQPLSSVTGYDPRPFSRSTYFPLKGRQFVLLDARPLPIDDEFDPRGRFAPGELNALSQLLNEHAIPTTLFLHYPPIELASRWIDRSLVVQYDTDQTLHAMLRAAASPIDGVFFGHIHHGVHVIRDNILYTSVGATSCHFNVLPFDENAGKNADGVAFFNYVTLTNAGPIVKQQWCMIRS